MSVDTRLLDFFVDFVVFETLVMLSDEREDKGRFETVMATSSVGGIPDDSLSESVSMSMALECSTEHVLIESIFSFWLRIN